MAWLPASRLLLEQDPPSDPLQAAERLRWLGRYGLREQLQAEAGRLRSTPHWSACVALALSLGWLLASDGRAADRAFLEADRLEPAFALVPDPWGRWSPPAPQPLPEGLEAELVAAFQRWRWLDPELLRAEWAERAAADWRWALSPEGLDGLALLVRHREALAQPLQPFLAELVPDTEMDSDPAQALQFWGFLCDLLPDWTYARLKAAELALRRGDQGQALLWLEQAPEADRANAWHWDLRARAALASSRVSEALDHWGEAVRQALAAGDADAQELAELFRQRRREARRGPGLLEARSLLTRGCSSEALVLLEQLIAQDPQWQPLRTLLDQALLAASGADPSTPAATPAATDTATDTAMVNAQLDRFAALLDRAAARHSVALPQPESAAEPSIEASQQLLERFTTNLSAAEVRLALSA